MKAEIRENLYGKTVAVAVSGGADSMALLHFSAEFAKTHPVKVVAINVEHGIRGDASVKDSVFVKDYCAAHGIPLFAYSVNAPEKAEADKMSIEQAARALRYECFFDAINTGKCDAVLTAHHSADNLESILFNLFRGTGVKGLTGIKDMDGKIFRPLSAVSKAEINDYVAEHNIPFVVDETNFCDDYSRNFLRLNVIPRIKEIFPEAEKSAARLAETLRAEDEFLDALALDALRPVLVADKSATGSGNANGNGYYILTDCPRAVMARAVVIALKKMGLIKDYEKVHIDAVCDLKDKENGKRVVLPHGIAAAREYDRITLFFGDRVAENGNEYLGAVRFGTGKFVLGKKAAEIVVRDKDRVKNLKSGLFADAAKFPDTTVIRFREKGDVFTKFGGGTKSLSDYLTDKKIPKKDRDGLLVVADGKDVLAIVGVAVSDKVKVDADTAEIIQFI